LIEKGFSRAAMEKEKMRISKERRLKTTRRIKRRRQLQSLTKARILGTYKGGYRKGLRELGR